MTAVGGGQAADTESKPPCINIADKFNEHFLSLGSSGIFNAVHITSYKQYLSNPPLFSMYRTPIYSDEVGKFITDTKTTFAGDDDISSKLLFLFFSTIDPHN